MCMPLYKEYDLDLDHMSLLARELDEMCKKYNINILLLSGALGTGKTTLARSLIQFYNHSLIVTSPTFAYINYYTIDKERRFMHLDLYRATYDSSFLNTDDIHNFLQEKTNNTVIIEWPELMNYDWNVYGTTMTIDIEYIPDRVAYRKFILKNMQKKIT